MLTIKGYQRRTERGSFLAESPGVLLVFFIFLAFPLINLAAIGVRSYFLVTSVREAAHRACKSLTYSAPAPLGGNTLGNNVPAVLVANQTVKRYLTSFRGVQANVVKVGIVVIDNASGVKSGPYYAPLTPPIEPFSKMYYLDVEVLGQVEPLLSYTGGLLGPIPGLTSPFLMYAHGQEVFENPKGLTL